MQSNPEIQKWYNSFSSNQLKTGVNLRHYTILEKLIQSGLKKNHHILEVGCGIGTLTGLIGSYLKQGSIIATDISDESIEIARKRLHHQSNISFLVSDMEHFKSETIFDFIIFPDVLEHIPEENHLHIFKTLFSYIHEHSVICIHIPHPRMIEYYRLHEPEKLQIIDQSIEANSLLHHAYLAGFQLISYQSYSLYDNYNDYAFVVLKKMQTTKSKPLTQNRIILKKLFTRLRLLFK